MLIVDYVALAAGIMVFTGAVSYAVMDSILKLAFVRRAIAEPSSRTTA